MCSYLTQYLSNFDQTQTVHKRPSAKKMRETQIKLDDNDLLSLLGDVSGENLAETPRASPTGDDDSYSDGFVDRLLGD